MKLYKEIIKQIKKYDKIVIARHIGADPDALGSQFSLKDIILENFKDKLLYKDCLHYMKSMYYLCNKVKFHNIIQTIMLVLTK